MAYGLARTWDMAPSEFWALSPEEFWWEFDYRVLQQKSIKAPASAGGFSEADWSAARKRHSERVNGTDRPSR